MERTQRKKRARRQDKARYKKQCPEHDTVTEGNREKGQDQTELI